MGTLFVFLKKKLNYLWLQMKWPWVCAKGTFQSNIPLWRGGTKWMFIGLLGMLGIVFISSLSQDKYLLGSNLFEYMAIECGLGCLAFLIVLGGFFCLMTLGLTLRHLRGEKNTVITGHMQEIEALKARQILSDALPQATSKTSNQKRL